MDSSLEEIEVERESSEDSILSNKEASKDSYSYSLQLKFHTNIFGTFKQKIIFDFGSRPFLSKVRDITL